MTQLYDPTKPANATTANADEVRNNLNSLATHHKGSSPPSSAQGGWIWLDDNDYSGFGSLNIYDASTAVAAFVQLIANVYDVPYLGFWRDPKTNTAAINATTPDYDWELHVAKNTGIQRPILWAFDPTSPSTWRRVAPGPGTGLTYDTTNEEYDVDVGITANKIVQLTAAAKLPAVDGSLLTNNVVKIQNAVLSPTATATDSVAILAGLGIDIAFGSLDDITIGIDSSAVVTSFDKYGSGSPAFVGDVFLREDGEQSVVITPSLSTNSLILTSRCGIVDDDWLMANTDYSPSVLEGDLTDWTRSIFARLGLASPTVVDACDVMRALILMLNTIQLSQTPGFTTPSWEDKGTTLNPGNPFQDDPLFTAYIIAPSASVESLPVVGSGFPSGGSAPSGLVSVSLQTGIMYVYESNSDSWEPINPIQIREDAVQRNNGWPGVLNFVGAGVDVVEQSLQNGVSSITISIPGIATNHQDSHQAGGSDELQGLTAIDGTDRVSFSVGDGMDSDKFIFFDIDEANNPGFRFNATTNTMQVRNGGGAGTWNDIGLSGGSFGNTFTFGDGTDSDKTIVADIGHATNPAIKYETSTNTWERRIEGGAYEEIAVVGDVPTTFYMNFVVGTAVGAGDFILGQTADTPDDGVPMFRFCSLAKAYVTEDSGTASFDVRVHNVTDAAFMLIPHNNTRFSSHLLGLQFNANEKLAVELSAVSSPAPISFTLTLEFLYL